MMVEQHYTPEQLAWLAERRATVGEERIAQVEAAWVSLIGEVRAAIDGGIDPTDARARALAERWVGLVREFSGGDPAIERAARAAQEDAANKSVPHPGYDPRMPEYMAYVERALGADEDPAQPRGAP